MFRNTFRPTDNEIEDDEEDVEEEELSDKMSLGRRFRATIFQPRLLFTAAIMLTTFLMLPGIRRMAPRLKHRREYVVKMDDIRITQPPAHVPADFVSRVFFRAQLPGELSLLDDATLLKVADAFIADPWVSDIRRVKKDYPSFIQLDIVYRQPAAMVRIGDGLYPIDEEGVLLPSRDFTRDEALQFPIISNVRSVPSGTDGMPWGDPGVVGAARLARAFNNTDQPGEPTWSRFDLAEIRVPRRQAADESMDDMVFELVTHGGSRIVWGRAPGIAHPAELTVEQKIARLDSYIASYGSFEDRNGACELDIRHWHEISRRAIGTRPFDTDRY